VPEPVGAGLGEVTVPAAAVAAVALAELTTVGDWIALALSPASSMPPQQLGRSTGSAQSTA
jgi:hypothetical protein